MDDFCPKGYLRIHGIIPSTTANGPGERIGIWLQGCLLNCPGCHNPETHSFRMGKLVSLDQLVQDLCAIVDSNSNIEGITISGGEPLHQAYNLFSLVKRMKMVYADRLGWGMFTGYRMDEILEENVAVLDVNHDDPDPDCFLFKPKYLVEHMDFVVSGRYVSRLRVLDGLISSSNQELYLVTSRYRKEDFGDARLELLIEGSGVVCVTGFGL